VIELVNLSMMRTEDLLKGRRHILEEVKSVGDLGCIGRSLPNVCGTNRATTSFTPVSTFADLMPDGQPRRGIIAAELHEDVWAAAGL
jgi:hypothetical protein